MTVAAILPITMLGEPLAASATTPHAAANGSMSFGAMLEQGIAGTSAKLDNADSLVAAFATDGNIPLHQVTYALEEARIALEMMVQVRNHIVDAYQQVMNMQV